MNRTSNPSVSKLPLIILGTLLLLALLVIAGFTLAQNKATFAEGSPESALQEYVDAVYADDVEGMYDRFSPRLDNACSSTLDDYGTANLSSSRATLAESQVDGDRAIISLTFTDSSFEDPFDDYRYERTYSFELRRDDGDWLITNAEWPWTLRDCADAN